MGAGVPVIPAVVWGSQRIWTKKVKRDLKRNKFPISVSFGEPLYFTKEDNVEEGEAQLRAAMQALLLNVQSHYPDSHEGARWAPVRLGGSAPAPLN
jgi:1-acyl-sn-glycerol-3-phosphate acyltransferase